MDDYSMSSLIESKNEWCVRLVNIFTPCIIEGLRSIFNESYKLCIDNDEEEKYLMTFQNLLSRVPKWNAEIISNETQRIINSSGCTYIEDLMTCVHIIQLKALTCTRVGTEQKKVDINIPSLPNFVHKVYINTARKVYTNIYLFEKGILPLQIQKNNRELEIIIKETILNTVRESVPVHDILRAYLDETEEQNVSVVQSVERIPVVPEKRTIVSSTPVASLARDKELDKKLDKQLDKEKEISVVKKTDIFVEEKREERREEKDAIVLNKDIDNNKKDLTTNDASSKSLNFSNVDLAITSEGTKKEVDAPKDIETLNNISKINQEKRRLEDELDNDDEKISIGEEISLGFDIVDLSGKSKPGDQEVELTDVEIL